MTRRGRDRLEPELEDLHGIHDPHRTVAFARVTPDPAIELLDLGVRESRVRLCDRDERAAVPHAKGVIGQQARAAAVARLRVDQDRVHRQRIDLPLPPVAAPPADAIR
jgi:hypothetical protein